MRIRFDPSPLKEGGVSGHILRFGMGGAVTVCTGLVAKAWGPKLGGLSLALPAILPTGIALIVKLQNEKAGPRTGGDRARRAAVLETFGASIGGLGMIAFAIGAWRLLTRWPGWLVLVLATAAWATVASAVWFARKARSNRRG